MRKGFTLIELAIVLVIIGIIIGAILKGQELINNARAKRLQNDMRGLVAMMWTFSDRYGRFPGDCNRDGLVDVNVSVAGLPYDNNPSVGFCNPNTPSATATDPDQWLAELKKAKILGSDADNRDLARHLFSGYFIMAQVSPNTGTKKFNGLIMTDVPCFAAKMIDSSVDNTLNSAAGRIRVVNASSLVFTNNGSGNYSSCTTEDTPIDIVYLWDKAP